MSEYPRLASESPPRFPLDRIVAAIYALFVVGSLAVWLFQNLRGYADPLRAALAWWWFYALYLGFTLFYLFVLTGVGQSRRWGFVTLFLLLSLTLSGMILMRRAGNGVLSFPFWLYCVARLFGFLGPRPGGGRVVP